MNEEQLLRRAASAWSDGDRHHSLRLLKDAVRLDPSLGSVRRVLAERYREMGAPDQAGRWGISLDGWTTDLERDRLARLLAGAGIDESQAVRFLALPDGRVPDSVMELLEGPTSVYRDRFQARLREEYGEEEGSPLFIPTIVLWALYMITSVAGAYTIFGFAVFGSASSILARSIGLLSIGVLVIALASSAAMAASIRAKGWTAGWAMGSIVVGGLFVWGLASGWTLR